MFAVLCSCLCRCLCFYDLVFFFFFKQKTAYEMRISDWSSDVCSSDLRLLARGLVFQKLLQQHIVMVGKLFQHVKEVGRFPHRKVGRTVDPLRRRARPVMIGAFQCQLEKAGDPLALASRHSPRDPPRRPPRLEPPPTPHTPSAPRTTS